MLTGHESADELLALWADLLRHRDGLQRLSFAELCVRYATSLKGEMREYYAVDIEVVNDLLLLFAKDLDCRILTIEDALCRAGIKVDRSATAKGHSAGEETD